MAALRACIRCGRLNRGRSYCPGHEPTHASPSSTVGRVPHLRRKARARDGGRCTVCRHPGSKDNPLHVHHRAEVATHGAAANRLDLMVTLCADCHRRGHRSS
jgi:5-methylcytosine-specific restriction endonuclease McrA